MNTQIASQVIVAPTIDPDFLLTHLEYAQWATQKTLAMIDKLPAEALTRSLVSSFPSILETLRHSFHWDKYYLTHLQGGNVEVGEIVPPTTYDALKQEWATVHADLQAWTKANLPTKQNQMLSGWADWPVWMVVMQVANHATHHLGQLVTLIRQAGYAPQQADWTDLILYYLHRYPQNLPISDKAGH